MLDSGRDYKASRNKVGGAIVVGGRYGFTAALSPILLTFMHGRMMIAGREVFVVAPGYVRGTAVKDTRGMDESRELGRTIVRIAKATASLRGT